MDEKQIKTAVEALAEAKTHLDKAQHLRTLVVAAENLAANELKEMSPLVSSGAIPHLLRMITDAVENETQPTLGSLHFAYQATVILSNLYGELNTSAVVNAGALPPLIKCVENVDSSLEIIGDDPNLLSEKEKLTLKIRSRAIETIANLLENNPHTTLFVHLGGLNCLISFITFAKEGDDRREALRALLYIAENAIVREDILKTYQDLFPATPFENLQAKLIKHPTDKEEKTFVLDILRCLDVLTDYIKPGKVFYDVSDFPFIKLLEDNFPKIKEEFLKLEQHHLVSWPEKYLCKKGWDVFGLYAFKNKLVENCNLCPETSKILEQIPGMTTVMFSCIQPRTHIRPHVGYYQYSNRILRCHLGITIPKDGQTALKVNGQIQTWEEGKCFVFDDTFRHEAWNKSATTTRVVLMIDFDFKTDPSLRNPDFFWGDPSAESEPSGDDAIVSPDLLMALMNFKQDPTGVKSKKETETSSSGATQQI